MRVIAIDPGTNESGFIVWDDHICECGFISNPEMLSRLRENNFGGADLCAIEMIASYGMAVGKETFETCVWIGRMIECSRIPVRLVYRREVKIFQCGTMKAKDGNIRQSLIDKHGVVGTKKNPGKLYGVSGHIWQALALADYARSEIKL